MPADLRRRLFALQQRVAITSAEALALLAFTAILAVGLVVSHIGRGSVDVNTSAYASLVESLELGAAMSVEEALAALPTDSAAAVEEVRPAPAQRTTTVSRAPVRVDPNTASSQMLQRLPGIGPALAARIIEHREQVGPFRTPRDLTAVRGIGPRTLERMEPYIAIAPIGTVDRDQFEDDSPGSGSTSDAAPSPP